METKNNKRNFALDVIRALAITLVITIHTFSFDVNKGACLMQESILCLAKMAVPLFVLLTGYLNNYKTIEDYYAKGKWKGCLRVLLAYVVLGSLCYVVSILLGRSGDVIDYIKKMLSFKLTPYGWYIEMWIGLFFMTPFLNIIYRNLNKRAEHILLVTLLLLSSVALFFNRNGNTVIPAFWMSLWPITLYYLGAYLSRHEVAIRNLILWGLLFIVVFGEPLLNLCLNTHTYLYFWGGQDGLVYLVSAFATFVLVLRIFKDKYYCNFVSGGVFIVSKQSLNMYLISALFDSIGRHLLREQITNTTSDVLPFLFLLLCFSFICSLLVSCLYDKIIKIIHLCVNLLT